MFAPTSAPGGPAANRASATPEASAAGGTAPARRATRPRGSKASVNYNVDDSDGEAGDVSYASASFLTSTAKRGPTPKGAKALSAEQATAPARPDHIPTDAAGQPATQTSTASSISASPAPSHFKPKPFSATARSHSANKPPIPTTSANKSSWNAAQAQSKPKPKLGAKAELAKPVNNLKMPACKWSKCVLQKLELATVFEQGIIPKFQDWDDNIGPGIRREFAIEVSKNKYVPGRLNREPSPESRVAVLTGDEEDVAMDFALSDGDPPPAKRAKAPPPRVLPLDPSLAGLPAALQAAVESAMEEVVKRYPPPGAQYYAPTIGSVADPKPDSAAVYYQEIEDRLAAHRVTAVSAPDSVPHNTTLPIPRPYSAPILTESQVRRKAASIAQPVKHTRTLVASNIAVPNLTITIWDCPSLHPILTCAVPVQDPLAPAPRMLTPLAVKHLTFDSAGQPVSGPTSRSTWRFRVEDGAFAQRALLELRLEGGPSAQEQAARGESWIRESVIRLERGIEQVYCLIKKGSLEWTVRAE